MMNILRRNPSQITYAVLLEAAQEQIERKPTYGRFIDGTPLSNDIAVWMADFAEDYRLGNHLFPPPLPEPFSWGLLPWCWRRLTGWRDEHGRKAQLIGWRG